MFSQTPKSSNKTSICIKLGLLFTPDDGLAFGELKKAISEKDYVRIPAFQQEAMPVINQFKTTNMSDEAFGTAMVRLVKKYFNKDITAAEFKKWWLARYTDQSINSEIKSISASSKEYDFEGFGLTNRWDSAHIAQTCQDKKIEHTAENDIIKSIQGVPFKTSFSEDKSIGELFIGMAKDKFKQGVKEWFILTGSEDNQTIPALKEAATKANDELMHAVSKMSGAMNIHVIKIKGGMPLMIENILKQQKETIQLSCAL